jgi:hypothetical protein
MHALDFWPWTHGARAPLLLVHVRMRRRARARRAMRAY